MRSLKVLILEDNPFQLMALHQMLNAFRIFDVLTAESVESARCSLASRGAIDLAICDVHLEGPAALESVKSVISDELLTNKQDELYNTTVEQWVKEANAKVYKDKLAD